MTALTILLAVIRDFIENAKLTESINGWIYQAADPFKEIPAQMRVTPWEELKDLFSQYIYTTGGTKKYLQDAKAGAITFRDDEDPRCHILEAIETFGAKILKADAENFVRFLLNKTYVVYIATGTQASAFRLFNVLNSRGLSLETVDLLKSENLGAIADSLERDRYAQTWRNIEEGLGREELNGVIAYVRTIKLKERQRIAVYDEFQDIFRKGLLTRGKPFIDYLESVVDIYREEVLDGDLESTKVEERNNFRVTIDLMRRFIPFSDWIPPLIAFRLKFNRSEDYVKFLFKLEAKVILEWVADRSPTERTTSLNRLFAIIEETDSPEKVIDSVELPEREVAINALNKKLDDENFYSLYGKHLARYLLLRIDKESWEIANFPGYPGAITVEHVLPQKPEDGGPWMKAFNQQDRLELTNSLGNLVLLSGRKNSAAQNYDFDRKKRVYFGKKGTAFRIT